MQKGLKTTLAATLALGLSLSAFVGCSGSGSALEGDTSGTVVSNGGFVVEKGEYVYFINGQESYTSSNEFGSVVKGSLMRIKKSALSSGAFGSAEIVVPSLMVAGDYTSGIYIFGDRVYYATPTTAKNQSGAVENSYLDMKSTKLDGTDTSNYYFRLEDNSTPYRFVEENGVVYCMYVSGKTLYSFNTKDLVSTKLAENMSDYVFSKNLDDVGVYYTMSVPVDVDKASSYTARYNQIYYVSAATTEAPYTYEYDEDYLKEYREDKEKDALPYYNLGTLVLDGVGHDSQETQYSHSDKKGAFTPSGYTYKIVSYENDGIYYTRNYVDKTSSSADGGWLYYISNQNLLSSSWNAISGNADNSKFGAGEYNDIIAYNTDNASASAIFFNDNGKHSYVYVEDTAIFRNDVTETQSGITVEKTRIADAVNTASLLFTEVEGQYGYVYFSEKGTNGNILSRAVYNGTKQDYNALLANKNYRPVRFGMIDYTAGWYAPEKIGNYIFYPNAETFDETTFNYVCVLTVPGDNTAVYDFNEKFAEIAGGIMEVRAKYNSLGNLMLYHFWMAGENQVFNNYYLDQGLTGKTPYANTDYYKKALEEAKEEGYTDTYLYTDYFKDTFNAFVTKTGEYAGKFVDENGKDYSVQTYFYNWIGKITDAEMEKIDSSTKNVLVNHITIQTEEEDEGLPTWAIVLIVVGSVVVAAGIACAIVLPLVLRKKKTDAPVEPKPEKMFVDTTDDEEIDVYASDEPEEGTVEISPAEATEEPTTEIEVKE